MVMVLAAASTFSTTPLAGGLGLTRSAAGVTVTRANSTIPDSVTCVSRIIRSPRWVPQGGTMIKRHKQKNLFSLPGFIPPGGNADDGLPVHRQLQKDSGTGGDIGQRGRVVVGVTWTSAASE